MLSLEASECLSLNKLDTVRPDRRSINVEVMNVAPAKVHFFIQSEHTV